MILLLGSGEQCLMNMLLAFWSSSALEPLRQMMGWRGFTICVVEEQHFAWLLPWDGPIALQENA